MVKGLRNLRRKFVYKIPREVRKATRDALEKGANEIVTFAKSLVPVDKGELRDSIGWTWGDPPKGSITLAKSRSIGRGERITIYAGNDKVFWARWQEFGTQFIAAQPFFFVSYRLLKRRVKGRVTRSMKKAIRIGAK